MKPVRGLPLLALAALLLAGCGDGAGGGAASARNPASLNVSIGGSAGFTGAAVSQSGGRRD